MSQSAIDKEMELLEQRLLMLGCQELDAETLIRDLRKLCRALGEAGKLSEADAVWTEIEQLRSSLAKTQAVIMAVETKLYGLRNRKRR